MHCEKCGAPVKKGEFFCVRHKQFSSFQCITFEQFQKQFNQDDEIKKILEADFILQTYAIYKHECEFLKHPKIAPILCDELGGGFKQEHQLLGKWFVNNFFHLLDQKMKSTGGMENKDNFSAIKKNFCRFHSSVTKNLCIFTDDHRKINPLNFSGDIDSRSFVLLLKKAVIETKTGNPVYIDAAAKTFEPGSVLFFLELFSLLHEREILDEFQIKLTLSPEEAENIIKKPVLLIEPWQHQQDAYRKWVENESNGIILMATATGKTLVGLKAIEDFARDHMDGVIRIFAHSTGILDQWRRETIEKLGLHTIAGPNDPYSKNIHVGSISIHFDTVQKVSKCPEHYPADLVIVDEVHHQAAIQFSNALSIACDHKMGLSATVEPGEKRRILEKKLGKIVFEYDMTRALIDGILPEFEWKVCPVYLSIPEQEEFEKISSDIFKKYLNVKNNIGIINKISKGSQIESIGDFIRLTEIARLNGTELPDEWKVLQALILKRRWIIHKSKPRLENAISLARELSRDRKVVIFAMDIESCISIETELNKAGIRTFLIHSKKNEKENRFLRNEFRKAPVGALIGARMLDEGIDIPDASVGINIASSKTRLQLIQRMGRILRKHQGKKKPVFYHYVAIPEPTRNSGEVYDEDLRLFLDDLSWVQDTALKMGLDAEVITTEAEIIENIKKFETGIYKRYSGKLKIPVKRDGTLNTSEIINQFSEEEKRRIVKKLRSNKKNTEISDQHWRALIKDVCLGIHHKDGTDVSLDRPGYWWILILGNRNPERIIELFSTEDTKIPDANDEVNSLPVFPPECDERIDPSLPEIEKDSPIVLLRAGEISVGNKQYDDAILFFNRYIEINPRNAHVLNELANCYYYTGNNSEAIRFYKKSLSVEPDDAVVLENLIDTLIDEGKSDEAKKYQEILDCLSEEPEEDTEEDGEEYVDDDPETISIEQIDDMTIGEFQERWRNINFDEISYECGEYIRKKDGGISETLILPLNITIYQSTARALSRSLASDPMSVVMQILSYLNAHSDGLVNTRQLSQREIIHRDRVQDMTIREFRKKWRNIDFGNVNYYYEDYVRNFDGNISHTLILPLNHKIYQKDAILIGKSIASDPITTTLQILAYWNDRFGP